MMDGFPDSPVELRTRLLAEQRKLSAVRELGRALGANLDRDHILATIVNKVPELLDAERATLYLMQRGREESGGKSQLVSTVVMGGLGPASGATPCPPLIDQICLNLGEGIAGAVALTGQPLNIPDAYGDPRFNAEVDRQTGFVTRTILCVPIPDHTGRITGVLQALNRRSGQPFDEEDEALLSAMAAYCGVSLENSNLYQSLLQQNEELLRTQHDLKQRIAELDLLFQIERESSAAMDLPDLLENLSRRALQLLSAQAGIIALRMPSGELDLTFLRQDIGKGESTETAIAHRVCIDAGPSLISWVVQNRQVILSNDVPNDPRASGKTQQLLGIPTHQALVIPLEHAEADQVDDGAGQALGAIAVVNKLGPHQEAGFDLADQKLLTLIAGHAARAIVLSRTRMLRTREHNLASIGRMLAGIMHDLRTPMTIVSGYAQLMASSDDAEERERFVRLISKQFELMEAMTGEVMAFAKGETKLLIRRVHLNRFAEEVREQLMREVPPSIRLDLEARYVGTAYFDELKLLRLVHNLSRNAVQAMSGGGVLRIVIDSSETPSESGAPRKELVFTFSDTGEGLPDEVQAHLFEAFVSSRKDGGTGLGLAIVKKIVDDHGGRILVSTRRGEGTTFTVIIPMSRE